MANLAEIVAQLKGRIAQGIEPALTFLEEQLSPDSPRYNEYVQIKARYNSCQKMLLLGTLEHSEYDLTCNNVSKALLMLADELTEADLRNLEPGQPAAGPKRGEILYHIPAEMALQKEVKCAVRIAWKAETLNQDWQDHSGDVQKSLRIAEIMAVALLNADESNPFAIRTLTEPVQLIDPHDFTEWIFYVKPLRSGHFSLVLRVSVIEIMHNREYKKDLVLEEEIEVLAESPSTAAPLPETFKPAVAGVVVGAALIAEPPGWSGAEPPEDQSAEAEPQFEPAEERPRSEPPPQPPASVPAPAPAPSQPYPTGGQDILEPMPQAPQTSPPPPAPVGPNRAPQPLPWALIIVILLVLTALIALFLL